MDKTAIARNFSRAAGHYDTWATAQASIAEALVAEIPASFRPRRMVDLGCGTGLLSAGLLRRFPEAGLLGIDIAEGMVEHCRAHWTEKGRAVFVQGDAEDPRWAAGEVDLVACSSSAQWFDAPEKALRLWTGVLSPGGLMACALLSHGSFTELENAYRETLQSRWLGLQLPEADTMPRLFQEAGLHFVSGRVADVQAWYGSAREALRSFREIGAVFLGQQDYVPLHAAEVRNLLGVYERYSDAAGRAPVTYRVHYVIAEKRA